jgi:hypothetical protein
LQCIFSAFSTSPLVGTAKGINSRIVPYHVRQPARLYVLRPPRAVHHDTVGCAIAEGIAKDARENLDGVDVCHVGPLFVDEDDKCQFLHCYVVLPKDGGKTFAANVVTLSHIEEPWFAKVNRQALIVCLEPLFARVQIFGDELAFAKYCQGQWPSDAINKVVSDIIKARGLN